MAVAHVGQYLRRILSIDVPAPARAHSSARQTDMVNRVGRGKDRTCTRRIVPPVGHEVRHGLMFKTGGNRGMFDAVRRRSWIWRNERDDRPVPKTACSG